MKWYRTAQTCTPSILIFSGTGATHRRSSLAATRWLEWTVAEDFEVGTLLSWKYAGTESANAYTTKFLRGETADVYDVTFSRRKLTFYIVPPSPDGNVRYMLIRRGASDDETADLWARNPLGLF